MGDPFFDEATFCHLKENKLCIREVREQGGTDSCYAFAVTSCIYAHSVLSKVDGNPFDASRQELMDCLHKVLPPKFTGDEVVVPPQGLPNSYPHTFKYFAEIGVYPESVYPYVGKTSRICKEPLVLGKRKGSPSSSSPGDRKIFIGGYERCEPENVIQDLERQPLVGRILATPTFRRWKGTDVFSGASMEEDEEYTRILAQKKETYKKERRNFLLARRERREGTGRNAVEKEEKSGPSSEAAIEGKKEPCPSEDRPRLRGHAVLIIGHDMKDGIPLYICQNSYGKTWGHEGYFKIPQAKVSQIYYPREVELRILHEEEKGKIREKVQKMLDEKLERIRKEDEDIMKGVKGSS